jgi:hypothetical protein
MIKRGKTLTGGYSAPLPVFKWRYKNPISSDEELRLRRDHGPHDRYLPEKIRSVKREGYTTTHRGTKIPRTFGSDTGSFNRPVLFPLTLLKNVPGLAGEETFDREESLRYLIPFMTQHNHLPTYKNWKGEQEQTFPMIQAWLNGKWYINEGNHRIKVARMLGWKYIPLEIRWYTGGDIKAHPEGFTPEQVIAFDTLAHNEGYSVINFRGKIRTL